jgi:hypothetical protein
VENGMVEHINHKKRKEGKRSPCTLFVGKSEKKITLESSRS